MSHHDPVFEIPFVDLPSRGRRYESTYRVRLGDTDAGGALRLDGAARFLQDVGTDDWADTGIESEDVWVVRRTTIRLAPGGRWPRYLEMIRLVTWCGGAGAAWAERRTTMFAGDAPLVEATALWVPIDQTGRPVRLRPSFFDVYGEAIDGRRVSGRVVPSTPTDDARARPWTIRRADFDVVNHVNNAALWQAIHEVAPDDVHIVSVTHHGPVERGEEVVLYSSANGAWLEVDGAVRVSAVFA